MRIVTRVLVAAVLVCLLLPLAAGRRHLHGHHHGRTRHAVTVRLRRSGTNDPAHHPVRPAPAAMLPPDEDDDSDRLRFAPTDAPTSLSVPIEELPIVLSPALLSAWPVAPDRPLFRTLGILLI
ncbi:MAG TPA: hypothetical protein VH643_22700 [Gemmataceae bacterium]